MTLVCDATYAAPGDWDHTCRCSRYPCTGPHFCSRCGTTWVDRYTLTDTGETALRRHR